jgi:hypothetical protein
MGAKIALISTHGGSELLMNTVKEKNQFTSLALQRYILLTVFYILLIFLLPASTITMRDYQLSAFEYRIVVFAVALPAVLVWLAAFIGYAKLREYAYAIRKTPEGIYFDQLAEGCTWLAWSLPVSTIIPTLLNAIANQHPGFHASAIIISNYLSLILPLIGFSMIASASRGLLGNVKVKLSLANARVIIVAFLILGVLYCFLTFSHFDLSSLSSTHNPYFLPAWLMVITVTIPYLYAWFMGILGVYEITLFSKHVRGILYRQALIFVVGGLLAVILSSVALQYINSVEPRVGHLVFNYRLVLVSLFRIIGGAGFVLLTLGASRLQKIEEV